MEPVKVQTKDLSLTNIIGLGLGLALLGVTLYVGFRAASKGWQDGK